MYNTALRIVNTAFEAEDIMQESFLAAFDKLDSFEGKVSFGAWLKRIVINRSLDAVRKRKLQFESIDDTETDIAAPEENSDDERNNAKEQIARIIAALPQLADNYRIVFSLYYLEGFDHQEIAQILDIRESTSRSQLTRARQRVLQLISN